MKIIIIHIMILSVENREAPQQVQEGHERAEERSECAETCLWAQGALPWGDLDKDAIILETLENWKQPSG